jgi:hypothetical protein
LLVIEALLGLCGEPVSPFYLIGPLKFDSNGRTMNDVDGPLVASKVYEELFRNEIVDLEAIPYALDDAVQELRRNGVSPNRWATYVHVGF